MYANAKVPESLNLPHERVGSDGYSVGLFQQQVVWGNGAWWWGDAATCMDPYKSAALFFGRLANKNYQAATTDAAAGAVAQSIQGSAFPDRYATRMADAQQLYDRIAGGSTVPDNRPDFNEFWIQTKNASARGGTAVDAFFIHTQEGGGGDAAAESLANFCRSTEGTANPVSYHYYISQASDGGVTVVDGVDTDLYSYSVLSANRRSINLCFAGSRASWSRADWLKQSNAIDVAAYLAVQDAKKYGFPTTVIAPPYTGRIPGISDHRYVTQVLKDGSHTDVGDQFPWDVFAAAVKKYATDTTTPAPAGPTPIPREDADLQLVTRFKCLGDRTLVEAVGAVGAKLGIEGCYDTKASK
ncbi:N-acetylmuramoyl-L-alanine amidase [Mycolicibacterium boenickei]|nr:N-acetylmuramoyl-L-alanine amidase [Mycolicibacterium boenickei]